MLTSVVPIVYERWWRPALGRIAKGLLGPDMAGEHEIARLLLELRSGDVEHAVCCFAALHLFAKPFDALTNMARVLTPGGRIAIFTSCRMRSAPMRFWDGFAGRGTGMRLFELDEVTDALAERGFDDIRQHVSGLTQFVGARRAA